MILSLVGGPLAAVSDKIDSAAKYLETRELLILLFSHLKLGVSRSFFADGGGSFSAHLVWLIASSSGQLKYPAVIKPLYPADPLFNYLEGDERRNWGLAICFIKIA